MSILLITLLLLMAGYCLYALAAHHRAGDTPRASAPSRAGSLLATLTSSGERRRAAKAATTYQDRADPNASVLDLEGESGWTPADKLQLSPVGTAGAPAVRLGLATDRRGKPIPGRYVYSQGATAVGIFAGAPNTYKTSGLLMPAALLHGRNPNGTPRPGGGLPLLVVSPKTEIVDACLKSRQAQGGPIAVWNVAGDADIPVELIPYLTAWTPLSEATTWSDARFVAMALCSGAGDGATSGGFWEKSAARLLAAALYAVVQRGSGTNLEDVYVAMTSPKVVTGAEGKCEEIQPMRALHDELSDLANEPLVVLNDGRDEERELRRRDARYAAMAIADCVTGSATTIGSMINTATTALSAALIPGVAGTAWDSPGRLDIRRHLIETPGTIAIVGSESDVSAARPFLTAFMGAVKRLIERESVAAGGHLERQLLWIIDELPVMMADGRMFAELLRTVRSKNCQLVWATQDLSSLDDLYGKPARVGITNATVDRLLFPGVSCHEALALASELAGEYLATVTSYSKAENRGSSGTGADKTPQKGDAETRTWSQQYRPLAPPGRLTKLEKLEAVLLSLGNCQARLKVVPWFTDPVLVSLAETGQPPASAPGAPQAGSRTTRGPKVWRPVQIEVPNDLVSDGRY